MIRIKITAEMWERAEAEAKKRNPDITHHFEISHMSPLQRDKVGFVGEFAACELLGIDWKSNIRENYKTIDDKDIVYRNKKLDIKTETLPPSYLFKIVDKQIKDDELYGRRLINKGQMSLLKKYDIVLFGLIDRDNMDYWYPIGWLDADTILERYVPTTIRPDGGEYPFAGLPVKTSDLKELEDLKEV